MKKEKSKAKKHRLSEVVETVENLIDDGGVSEPTVSYKVRVDSITSDLFDIEEKTNGKISRLKNEFGEEILRVDGEIPIGLAPKDEERYLFISYDQSVLTHGLHKYPAKFFPELPRWIIKKYSSEGNWVLDPFTGSATTNIECLLNKRHSVGVDIDPFSRFIAKVKTTPLNIKGVTEAYIWLKDQIPKFNSHKIKESDIPNFPYRNNWFNRYILEELAFIKKQVVSLEHKPLKNFTGKEIKAITNFFSVCFSSIIRAVSNADDNCTRTVIRKKLNKQIKANSALSKFLKTIDNNVPKIIEFSEKCPRGIRAELPENCDARDIKYRDEFFELAVTSPPYVNAVDYPRTHQLELYWLELAKGSLTPLKRLHVGTESVLHAEYQHLHRLGIKEADDVLSKLYAIDPRRSYILYKYLIDMRENLFEVNRVLKTGGRYVIVVGNNKMRGLLVETQKYLIGMAKQIGFTVESCFASEIIKHFIKVPREERIQTDWVLVLRK